MDTKTNILDCAENECRIRGFDAFSYADIASQVGIRKASIHHHFPTKADLAIALFNRYSESFFDDLLHVKKASKNGAQQLRAYCELYRKALNNGQSMCLCVAFCADRSSLPQEVANEINRFHQNSILWLIDAIEVAYTDHSIERKNGKIEDQAATILALMEGAQILSRGAQSIDFFDQATRPFLQMLDGES